MPASVFIYIKCALEYTALKSPGIRLVMHRGSVDMIRLVSAAVLVFMSSIATAGIEQDDISFSIYGSLSSGSTAAGDESDSMTLFGSAGYFFTDSIELQAVMLLSSAETNGSIYDVVGYGVNGNLYFGGMSQDIIPYIGVGALYLATDLAGSEDTNAAFTGQVGIKHFLTETVSINYQAQGVVSLFFDATILSVGLSVYLD